MASDSLPATRIIRRPATRLQAAASPTLSVARCIAGREIVFDADGFFNDFYDWFEANSQVTTKHTVEVLE